MQVDFGAVCQIGDSCVVTSPPPVHPMCATESACADSWRGGLLCPHRPMTPLCTMFLATSRRRVMTTFGNGSNRDSQPQAVTVGTTTTAKVRTRLAQTTETKASLCRMIPHRHPYPLLVVVCSGACLGPSTASDRGVAIHCKYTEPLVALLFLVLSLLFPG